MSGTPTADAPGGDQPAPGSSATPLPDAAAGAKMMFLIRRRAHSSREELIAHWFANHMPGVISAQQQLADKGRPHAWRYLATVFDPALSPASTADAAAWDGVAQLWFDEPLPHPRHPFGEPPRDSFQQKAEPYMPWATVEYVFVDGSERLTTEPLTLNAPYPTTRSGFIKVVNLVAAAPEADYVELARHWLGVHAPGVRSALAAAGGFRYVVSMSLDPARAPYVGMDEMYFPDLAAWQAFRSTLNNDSLARWIDPDASRALVATTEMVGIP